MAGFYPIYWRQLKHVLAVVDPENTVTNAVSLWNNFLQPWILNPAWNIVITGLALSKGRTKVSISGV